MTFELTDMEGELLVRLAREAISHFLVKGRKIPVPDGLSEKLGQKCRVFVTLNSVREGVPELRGCIGYTQPVLPLAEATIESAINAATGDPRFPRVSFEELKYIVIEVSVLTPPSLIEVGIPSEYPKRINIGRDGLIIERSPFYGILLPQVPVEWGWDEEEFLSNCCMKAGLAPDMWAVEGTRVYKFHAIIFAEKTPSGEITRKKLTERESR